jgi:hypothetical protein
MSDRLAQQGRSGERRGRGALGVIWAAAVLFLALLALLATRVAAGQDPALRARAASTPLPARRVLVRKIYEKKVIVHLPPSAPPQPAQASQQVSAAGGFYSSLPVTRTS